MQNTPNEEAWESKFSALPFFSDEEQIKQGRELYKRYLGEYPTAVNRWCEYIDLEMKYGHNDSEVEEIFRKCLVQVPDVEIAKRYIKYINTCYDDTEREDIDDIELARFKKIQEGAYSYAIKIVGLDLNASIIYREFMEFLSKSRSNEVTKKILMHNLTRIPMNERQEMFLEYEEKLDEEEKKIEHQVFEATKSSQMRLTSYYNRIEQQKKSDHINYCTKSKSIRSKSLLLTYIETINYESMIEGQPRYDDGKYTTNGTDKQYENCPHSIQMKARQERIYYAMNKMLLTFYRYPQAWIICAQYFQRRGNIELAINFLERGRAAVNCPLLKLYQSFCFMIQGNTEKALSLLDNDLELEQIFKLKIAARAYRINEFRKLFTTIQTNLKPYAFIAATEIEYFIFGRKTASLKLFQEALKRYPNNLPIIKSYYRFLNLITPSRFIPNALKTYGDYDLDQYMKNAILLKFKHLPKPKDTTQFLISEDLMHSIGEKFDDYQISGDSSLSQFKWKPIEREVNKDIIREFIYILPPPNIYRGRKIDVVQLMDILNNLVN
ncbi:hypothetical protein ENUP19_0265G0005 [Entamoeba nuttalli]|uniref:Suppressor of forked domain-containing protein n=1 Tax=Entamoeba nuttalli TaxID=412467 RepID=A0ABQ0DSM3_9EUKA